MVILGINIGLGASVCLLEDGVPVFAMEEERVTRQKGATGFPEHALKYLERHFQPLLTKCTHVALVNKSIQIFSRADFLRRYDEKYAPRSAITKARDKAYLARQSLKKKALGENAGGAGEKASIVADRIAKCCPSVPKSALSDGLRQYNHHDCHAAAVYLGLAQEADRPYLVLTLDGGGDGECATVQIGEKGALRRVAATESGNSIGNIYSIVTYLGGFTPHEHEYKLMGLAAYVPKSYRDAAAKLFEPFVCLNPDNPLKFSRSMPEKTTWAMSRMDEALRRKRFDNIAGGLQQFTEDLILDWVRAAIAETGVRDILLSGGVFMNVRANRFVAELDDVDSINIFPSPGDETNAFGACFLAHEEATGAFPNFKSFTTGPEPMVGLDPSEPETLSALERDYGDRCIFEDTNGQDAEAIANALVEGLVVARCDGPMEFGARALGNRSLLADPRSPDVVERINSTIKQRDFWMPFAPAILAEDVDEYLEIPESLPNGSPSRYMMFAVDSKPPRRDDMAAALHRFDKTARVQTVDSDLYPGFHAVLSAFKKKTGRACLLNTSFNVHGHPIVMTARQALDILVDSNLDAVALPGVLVKRRAASE